MGVLQDDLILSTELIMKIANRKDFVKLMFPTLALRQAIVQVWCGTHRTREAKGVSVTFKAIDQIHIFFNQITKHLLEK